jgi:pimeloyl-ACP methyl ester carboxylesterase
VPGPVKDHLIAETNARMEFINGLATSVRQGAEHDLSDRIDTLAVPTLILWGEEDVVVPFAVAEAYAAQIPNAELVLLPAAGHSPQLEAPERVADAIRAFLQAEN